MRPSFSHSRGQLVANFLAGSWRDKQPALDICVSDLELVTRLLYDSGGAGLAWWRFGESYLKTSACGELLHQGYYMQALQSAINEDRIVTACGLLGAAGIEPILIKGWSIARLYPHPTLRAYGDVDLLVRPSEYRAALEALNPADAWWVDLHSELSELEDRPIRELFECSRAVDLQGCKVRVLGPEDNLALLAIHFFKHGAWRPSWLCDIALMIESLPPRFDWNLCFGSNQRQASWIASSIVLAHRLLGAQIDAVPLSARARDIPDWLLDATLKQWGNLHSRDHLPVQPRPPFARSLRSPRNLLKEVRERWPDPITATFNLNGRVVAFPRFPYQIGAFALQAGQYLLGKAS